MSSLVSAERARKKDGDHCMPLARPGDRTTAPRWPAFVCVRSFGSHARSGRGNASRGPGERKKKPQRGNTPTVRVDAFRIGLPSASSVVIAKTNSGPRSMRPAAHPPRERWVWADTSELSGCRAGRESRPGPVRSRPNQPPRLFRGDRGRRFHPMALGGELFVRPARRAVRRQV
ncbi:hypothetical protein GQ53DRAFT_745240, partial [Thozetella sp. PMI_491]